jgi:hypothetical protein
VFTILVKTQKRHPRRDFHPESPPEYLLGVFVAQKGKISPLGGKLFALVLEDPVQFILREVLPNVSFGLLPTIVVVFFLQ